MRLAFWPDELPLPQRLVPTYRWHWYHGIAPVLVPDHSHEPQVVRPSGETYLQLANVDLDNLEAIRAFASSHGVVKPWVGDEAPDWRRGDDVERAVELLLPDPPAGHFTPTDDETWARIDEKNVADITRVEQAQHVEAAENFRLGARIAHDLANARRVLSEDLDPSTAIWKFRQDPEFTITTRAAAAQFITRVLSIGLETLHPTLHLTNLKDTSYEGSQTDLTPEWTNPIHTELRRWRGLFEIICIEVFNHIAENARYRPCANDNCQRLFVRQQGRAKHGQHRMSGTLPKYCSPSCARAQGKRDSRRRRRNEPAKEKP